MTANLLSRLQGLTAPDREVDRSIAKQFDWPDTEWSALEHAFAPAFTASLDAAVALCERVLPGWKKHMWDAGVFGSILPTAAVLEPDFVRKSIKGEPYIKVDGEGPTPAIALLIAILTALEARDGTE